MTAINQQQAEEGSMPEDVNNPDSESAEEIRYYQQLLLYMQDGLKVYEIKDTYTVYFRKADFENQVQEIVLSGESDHWYELLRYSYDEEKDWYTFYDTYEPVLSQDQSLTERDHYGLKEEIIADSDFITELSAESLIGAEARYERPGQPFTEEFERFERHEQENAYTLRKHQYLYVDKRKDVKAIIDFPQVVIAGEAESEEVQHREQINLLIRDCFFYGYYPQWDIWDPSSLYLTQVDRKYEMTRQDRQYLSLLISEYNDYRFANHPNQWTTGVTIDLETGIIMNLDDVLRGFLGKTVGTRELLESGIFRFQWEAEGEENDEDNRQEWLLRVIADDIIDIDKDFYLTETGLGLITSQGRYHVCMEADLEELQAVFK